MPRSLRSPFSVGSIPVVWDSGTFSGVTTFTFKQWPAGQFSRIRLEVDLAAANGGATYQFYGDFVGPSTASYRAGGMWSIGVSGAGTFTRSSAGSPGGLRSMISQDQLGVAAQRTIIIDAFPISRYIQASVSTFDTAGSSIAETRFMNFTTDATAVTGFRLDFNAISQSTDRNGYKLLAWTV